MTTKRENKYEFWQRLWRFTEEYPQALIVNADNVGSKQLQDIRRKLRGRAEVLFGKNTLLRAGLKYRMTKPRKDDEDYEQRKSSWFPKPELQVLSDLCKLNIGLIFCKDNMNEVRDVINESRVPAEARPGSIAPIDVTIPAGPTGMDPSMTSFFQALEITTKIVKGQIEIVTDVPLLRKDTKVGNNEAVLLKKLNIRPFTYGLKLVTVYDNGSTYSPEALNFTPDQVSKFFLNGVSNIAALSLALGIPTQASVSHSVIAAFKNLVAIASDTSFSFKEGDAMLEAIKNPGVAQAAAPTSAAPAAKAEAKKEVKKEESEDSDVGGVMFAGEEDEW
jgi:large subunit ribosomal protein LP0